MNLISRRNFLEATAASASLPSLRASAAGEIGTRLRPEIKTFRDPETGRTIRQLTSARANNYPLYYFTPSITLDGRYMVYHSERSRWVQLYRMDLETGESVQLTEGRTLDSGWAIFCQWRLRGIYNHRSALNRVKSEVYYFQDEELRATHLETLANRVVYRMPGRLSIGQADFSPDGRHFAFIHADRRVYADVMTDLEPVHNMRLESAVAPPIPATIGMIDTETGKYSDILKLDYHVHHVLWVDDRRVLVNHLRDGSGMWITGIDGHGRRDLRPPAEQGRISHQVVTPKGIFYDTTRRWVGRYDETKNAFEAADLPEIDGSLHIGFDPAGRFLFTEHQGSAHRLVSLHFPGDPKRRQLKTLRTMQPYFEPHQRYHAHPFLSPDRKWLFHTELVDHYSQISAIDVRDLVDLDEYWDRRS